MPQPFDIDFKSRYLPALHRALADPDAEREGPQLPRINNIGRLDEFQAYWETLDYLLRHLVGWSDLSAGLQWWYTSDRGDQEDPRLRLVDQIWNDHGQLATFAAHHWRNHDGFISTVEKAPPEGLAGIYLHGGEDFWRLLKQASGRFPFDPYYGGTNTLHLSFSEDLPGEKIAAPSTSFHSPEDESDRRAVLVVGEFRTWTGELQRFGETLPRHPSRSWYVEVFDRKVGYLGLFRQSRVTGRWFQGKHRFHIQGAPK